MRAVFSFMLAAWVGVACPLLCAARAESRQTVDCTSSCCGHARGGQTEPTAPVDSPEDGPDRCFCTANGFLAEKSDSLKTVFSQPIDIFVDFVPRDQASQLSPETAGLPRAGPPFPRSDIPLLI